MRQCTSTDCKKILDLWQWDSQLSKEKSDLRQDKIHLQEFRVYKVIGVILPKDVALTWTEREADEVGLEYCVRAGYDPREIIANWKARLISQDDLGSLQGCRAAMITAIARFQASRGPFGRVAEIPLLEHGSLDPHPQECWRVFNLERELFIHAKDFKPFLKNQKTVIAGGLERARGEIGSVEKSK